MEFTRRELHVIVAFVLILAAAILIPGFDDEQYELLYLLLVVVPLAIYVITDPERK